MSGIISYGLILTYTVYYIVLSFGSVFKAFHTPFKIGLLILTYISTGVIVYFYPDDSIMLVAAMGIVAIRNIVVLIPKTTRKQVSMTSSILQIAFNVVFIIVFLILR